MEKENFIEYNLKHSKFVAGKGEHCFKEVLDDFQTAQYINVLTYNISENNNVLLDSLKQAGSRNIPIKVITNIPNRWSTYFGNYWREKAKEKIDLYMRKLKPENIGKLSSVFFKFDNHGKIVMTDNIIYWGSANYSDESKKNYECGTISRDKDFIKFINETVISSILDESTNYYEKDYVPYIASMYSAISYLHNVRVELYDASYGIDADYYSNFEPREYFNYNENYIKWKQLEEIMETISEFESLLDGIIEEIESTDDEYLIKIDNFITQFQKISMTYNEKINDLCYDLKDMASFDEQEYSSNILSNEYALFADEEHLDYYAGKAFDKAREISESLIEAAKPSIDELLSTIDIYEDRIISFADELAQLSKTNDSINNT